jgi:hypothetical protein
MWYTQVMMNKERRILKELNSIMQLYDDDGQNDIQILHNKELNSILTRLAELLAPYLSRANSEICIIELTK